MALIRCSNPSASAANPIGFIGLYSSGMVGADGVTCSYSNANYFSFGSYSLEKTGTNVQFTSPTACKLYVDDGSNPRYIDVEAGTAAVIGPQTTNFAGYIYAV